MDSLPDYMKVYFHALYNFVDEMAFEILEKSGYDITPYLKKAVGNILCLIIILLKYLYLIDILCAQLIKSNNTCFNLKL